jgi:hypothetical protein
MPVKAKAKYREVRYRGVTPERESRLKTFAAALADLCDKFKVDIEASQDSEATIDVKERDFPYPDGYEFSATFQGVDADGVWNTFNPKCEVKRGLDVDRWWYRDEVVNAR